MHSDDIYVTQPVTFNIHDKSCTDFRIVEIKRLESVLKPNMLKSFCSVIWRESVSTRKRTASFCDEMRSEISSSLFTRPLLNLILNIEYWIELNWVELSWIEFNFNLEKCCFHTHSQLDFSILLLFWLFPSNFAISLTWSVNM